MSRLLFVDDEWNDYLTWGEPLAIDHRWEVEYAPGPREALAKLAAEAFEVVILDRQMIDPVTGRKRVEVGDELLEEIVACYRYVCPIMLTNFGDLEAAQRTTKHGAYRYFIKSEITVEKLNHACHKGMNIHFIKRARHALLALESVSQVVAEAQRLFARVQQQLKGHDPSPTCTFAYLECGPGGAFLLGTPIVTIQNGTTVELPGAYGFVKDYPCAEAVVRTRRFSLKTRRAEIRTEDGTLTDSPGAQLIVPVLYPENLEKCEPTRVTAVLWVESPTEAAFDRDDAEILLALADHAGDALAKACKLQQRGVEASEAEREGLLSEVAHRIRNPLQVTRSNLELVLARLRRQDSIAPEELHKQLTGALHGLETAIQAADGLRRADGGQRLRLESIQLAPLVEEAVDGFAARAEAGHCCLRSEVAPALPDVVADPVEMRYLLGCLLDNAVEAIEQQRTASGGTSERGEIVVSLCADPSASRSVLLVIQDNGCGIPEENLTRVFDRYFSTKKQDFRTGKRGLGLWEAKRFVEQLGGLIEPRNAPGGGAQFRIVLPASPRNEANDSRKILK